MLTAWGFLETYSRSRNTKWSNCCSGRRWCQRVVLMELVHISNEASLWLYSFKTLSFLKGKKYELRIWTMSFFPTLSNMAIRMSISSAGPPLRMCAACCQNRSALNPWDGKQQTSPQKTRVAVRVTWTNKSSGHTTSMGIRACLRVLVCLRMFMRVFMCACMSSCVYACVYVLCVLTLPETSSLRRRQRLGCACRRGRCWAPTHTPARQVRMAALPIQLNSKEN